MENLKNNLATESEVKNGSIIEKFKSNTENSSGENVKIKRCKFDSLTLYEVSDSELDIIEKGSPASIYLNFAIFLLSIAVSFFVSLLTIDYNQKPNIYIIFLLFTIVGFLGGLFLLILWFRNKSDFNDTIKKIKSRVS